MYSRRQRSGDVLEPLSAFAPLRCVEHGLLSPGAEAFSENSTTLFVDLAGFTPLTARLARLGSRGTEQLSTLLRGFFGSVTDLVLDNGGDPVAYGGDALTIVFDGDPASTLDAAVRSGEAIQELAARTAGSPTLAGPVTLQARIGVAWGTVTTAVARSQRRSVPVHLGSGLDLAVAAEGMAQTGEVHVHTATAAAGTDHSRLVRRLPEGFTVGSATDPDELARMLHPVVLARLGAGGALLESHRSITVAFVRFPPVEHAGLPKFLDEVGRMLELTDAADAELVQVSGGDKGMIAMIVFGAPVARDDDPLRTVETMLELRRSLGSVAVGVATGPVFTALLGSRRRRFAANTGPAVNLAARLTQAASTGQLLVDPLTWRESSAHLRTRGRPVMLRVKGVESPVEVRSVAGWRRSRPRQPTSRSSPLIGRVPELAAIEQLLDDVMAGTGRALVLEGEPGVGKTRLIREAADRARTRGIAVVLADAADHPHGRVSGLWRDCLCALTGTPPRADRRRWVQVLTATFPDVPEQIPALGRLIGVTMPASDLTRDMPADVEAEVAQALFARTVQDASIKQPVLLVIENTHHLDDVALALLAQTARSLARANAGLLMTSRPVERSAGPTGLSGERVHVGELDPSQAALLAVDVWGQSGGGSTPSWLSDAVTKRAGGNPLFVRTVTQAARTKWEPGQPAPAGELAEMSLTGLLSERVDRLSPEPRQLLDLLAVARRPIASDIAQTLFAQQEVGADAEDTAARLVAADLVQIEVAGVESYRLRHDVLQQVVYEGMSHAERVRLHGILADHLARTDSDPVEVAEHVAHLDDPDRARLWFPRAALSARASWAVNAAIGWWQRALPLLEGSAHHEAEVELIELLLVGGQTQEVLALVCDSPSVLGSALLGRRLHAEAEAALVGGQLDRSQAAVLRLLELTDGVDETRYQRGSELLVRLLCERGDTLGARATAKRQLARAVSAGDQRAIATAHASMGMALLLANLPREAAEHYEAARAGATELGDVVLEVHVLSDLAGCCHGVGDYATCVELLAKARKAADSIGYRRHLAYSLINEAELRSTLGDSGAAACAALAVQRSLELGDVGAASNALHAWVTSDPRLMGSASNWRRLVAVDVVMGRRGYAADGAAQLALVEARGGHAELARRAADDAVSRAADEDPPQLRRRCALARLLAAAGRRATRSPSATTALLDGLSALAADPDLVEVERAELAVERWRATRDDGDREAAVDSLRQAFAVEPSSVVRAWFDEIGTEPPAAPLELPLPEGIGRVRTTRAQLDDALSRLETAVSQG
jgi:predicted ATPase/class 3 adenylate cyclase